MDQASSSWRWRVGTAFGEDTAREGRRLKLRR
jgi:hypothetical protein